MGRGMLLLGSCQCFAFTKMKKQENTHLTSVLFCASHKLGHANPDGGLVSATPVTCSLLDFSYSDSHLDALAGAQLQ